MLLPSYYEFNLSGIRTCLFSNNFKTMLQVKFKIGITFVNITIKISIYFSYFIK